MCLLVALLIEPQTLGGTIIGVYLHQIFPSYLILLLLIIVMTLTTIRTTMKVCDLPNRSYLLALFIIREYRYTKKRGQL
jgi:hypothetical protein